MSIYGVIYMEHNLKQHFTIFAIISVALTGLFFEFSSSIVSVILIAYILILWKNKDVAISKMFLIIALIPIGYLLSIIFAVDRGLAFIGFIKFLPVILFAFIFSQWDMKNKIEIIKIIPFGGAILVILSLIANLFPILKQHFSVNGEINGFLQYPNTFALFLAIGLIIAISNFGNDKRKIIISTIISEILLAGILLTQSRSGILIIGIFLICFLFIKEYRKASVIVISTSIVCGVFGLIFLFITGSLNNLVDIGDISSLSTILGRFLYCYDALPQIASHPLGLGYYGYYFTQGTFQTGMYDIAYVHNDFIQIFLDAGWIAGIALIFAIIKSLASKTLPKLFKILILCISAFTLLDFHLQYLFMFMLLLLLLDYDKIFKKRKITIDFGVKATFIVIAIVNIYMGVHLGAAYLKNNELALKLYPANTVINISKMLENNDIEKQNEIADTILQDNESVAFAYDVKSKYYFSQGDFGNYIEYTEKSLELSRYDIKKYEEYINCLRIGINLYEKANDFASADYCKKTIMQIPEKLNKVKASTSFLAYKIYDKPELDLSDNFLRYITEISH